MSTAKGSLNSVELRNLLASCAYCACFEAWTSSAVQPIMPSATKSFCFWQPFHRSLLSRQALCSLWGTRLSTGNGESMDRCNSTMLSTTRYVNNILSWRSTSFCLRSHLFADCHIYNGWLRWHCTSRRLRKNYHFNYHCDYICFGSGWNFKAHPLDSTEKCIQRGTIVSRGK